MKVLCIGDIHYRKDQLLHASLLSDELISIVEKSDISAVIIMGDVLDEMRKIDMQTLCHAIKFLKRVSSMKYTYLLVGNHDMLNNKQECQDFSPWLWGELWSIPNLTVVSKPLKVAEYTFCPYLPSGRLIPVLDEKIPNWKESKIIFGHQEIKHMKMGAIVSTNGDEWLDEYPLLITGHEHTHQTIGNKMLCVGSSGKPKFGETAKSVSIITIPEEEANITNIQEERIFLTSCKKEIIRLPVVEVDSYEIPETTTLYKFIITGYKHEIDALRKNLLKKLNDWKRKGHKYVFETIDEEAAPLPLGKLVKHKSFLEELYDEIAPKPHLLPYLNHVSRAF